MTARVFEIMAMKLVPVLNRLPGLDELGFEEGQHYLGFSDMDEAVEKVCGLRIIQILLTRLPFKPTSL